MRQPSEHDKSQLSKQQRFSRNTVPLKLLTVQYIGWSEFTVKKGSLES